MIPAQEALKVLIADDNMTDRMLLSQIVRKQGHRVVTAENGQQAIDVYELERPQLVLLDALMPVLDGFDAARRIKALAGEEMVPIIFLTSMTEEEALVACLEAGGDDFLAKPYNQVILAAKIRAMNRLRVLHATMLEQRDEISRHHHHLLNEQRVAKAVFDQVAHSGCLTAPNIRYLQSPYALFNGDLLLAAFTPSGDMHVMLADFTGHGLPAAVGAMPISEVFYGMTAKGYGLAPILREMNAKLKRILPVGMFACATLMSLSFTRRLVEIWNGGMPAGYVMRAETGERLTFSSRHLPMGVLSSTGFDEKTEVFPIAPGDRVFLLSDGVVETTDAEELMFGVERLEAVLDEHRDSRRLFEDVLESLERFHGEARDDVSLVEITVVEPDYLRSPPLTYSDSGLSSPLDWAVSFEFRGQTLRRFNPLPYLLQLLQEIHGLRAQSGALYTVLTELYSNALEHGVLGLDSALKRDASGFAQYYQQRNERLEHLVEGYVRLRLHIEPEENGGRLVVDIQDSGKGFDVSGAMARTPAEGGLSGRGISLIRRLTHRAHWAADGRSARVEFAWQTVA